MQTEKKNGSAPESNEAAQQQSNSTSPTVTVSLSRKVNLGNYQSADVFISLNGLPMDVDQAEIDRLLSGPAALAFTSIAAKLREEVALVKGEWGNEGSKGLG